MADRTIRCTVESMNYSACGLEVGDYFDVNEDGLSLPPGKRFCYFAIAAAVPMLTGRIGNHDGMEPWLATEPRVACPDPPENVIMRIHAHPEIVED